MGSAVELFSNEPSALSACGHDAGRVFVNPFRTGALPRLLRTNHRRREHRRFLRLFTAADAQSTYIQKGGRLGWSSGEGSTGLLPESYFSWPRVCSYSRSGARKRACARGESPSRRTRVQSRLWRGRDDGSTAWV